MQLVKKPDGSDNRVSPVNYSVGESDHAYIVRVLLPGATRDSTLVSMEGERVVVNAKPREIPEAVNDPVQLTSFDQPQQIELKFNIDLDQAGSTFRLENGMLRLHIPNSSKEPRVVKVRSKG